MKRKIALGPGAASLILIVVILSLCMLSMLMQITVRNDVSLATRGTEMITGVYELFSRSEYQLAKLDTILVRCRNAVKSGDEEAYLKLVEENLPEGFALIREEAEDPEFEDDFEESDGINAPEENPAENKTVYITWNESLGKRVLTCTVKLLPPGEEKRTEWVVHTFEEMQQEMDEDEAPAEGGDFSE